MEFDSASPELHQQLTTEYVQRTQGELAAYAARVGNGAGLLRELTKWRGTYGTEMHCDAASLLEAMPSTAREQYIRAIAREYANPRVHTVLQEMVDAGVNLQSGLYGADQPDTGNIRRGLAYLRNIFSGSGNPEPRLKALEYAVLTQREPMQVTALGVAERQSFADALKARLSGEASNDHGPLRFTIGAGGRIR